MNNTIRALVAGAMGCICCNEAQASDMLLKTRDIAIRDPYIYADAKSATYFMYAQSGNRQGSGFVGVEAYASKDLRNWQPPQRVLVLPDDADVGQGMVWAPEMHAYQGQYYLLVTLTHPKPLATKKPVEKAEWPAIQARGTSIFRADSPLGPFKPLKAASHTPEDWMALDGTLFVEGGRPYLVFCHEWVQIINGTVNYVQTRDDLSDVIGTPSLMFKASSAPGALRGRDRGKVTDGCFLYRSPASSRLFMIWSTYVQKSGYSVVLARSESGRIEGPWIQQRVLYPHDGGHGMLFKSLDGRLLMALHQPNRAGRERLHLFEITDDGEGLAIKNEVNLDQDDAEKRTPNKGPEPAPQGQP